MAACTEDAGAFDRGVARQAHTGSPHSRLVVRGPTTASGVNPTRREGQTAHLPKVGGRVLISSFQVVKNPVGLGAEGERHRFVDGELAALLPCLGNSGVVELRADRGQRCFVHLRDP